MVQIIQTDNPQARLGRGFGQGLAEQIPKEVDRYRLSSGLNRLAENKEGLTPLQSIAELSKQPGGTELLPYIMPFLKQERAKQESANRAANAGKQSGRETITDVNNPSNNIEDAGVVANQAGRSVLPGVNNDEEGYPSTSIVTSENTLKQQKAFRPKTFSDLEQEASNLMQENPASFPTFDSALNYVNLREANRKEVEYSAPQEEEQRQEIAQTKATDEFDKVLTNLKPSKISEAVKKDLRQKVVDDVKSGMPALKAANKRVEEALDLDKAIQNMDTISGKSALDWFKTGSKGIKSQLEPIREKYKKYGRLNEFADDLVSKLQLSPGYASSLAYPIESNKSINSMLSKKGINVLSSKDSEKLYSDIADKITKNDSLLAISNNLGSKGIDPQGFKDYIQKRLREDPDFLNSRQSRELERSFVYDPTMWDKWFDIF